MTTRTLAWRLARALVLSLEGLLLGEPFAALAAVGRRYATTELQRSSSDRRCTTLRLTRGVDEGFVLADRVV